MRADSEGMFWHDEPRKRERGAPIRSQPPIPETGWTPPRDWPNLSTAHTIALDTETFDPDLEDFGPGWARHKGHLVGVSLAVDGGKWYFPIRHAVEPEWNMNPEHVLAYLRDTLCNPAQTKVGANLCYDVGWLREEGVRVNGPLVDVQYAEALLDENCEVALEVLGQKYLGEGKNSGLLRDWCMDYYGGTPTKWRANIFRTPPRLAGPYAEQDADLPLRIAALQRPRLEAENMAGLFRMECDLIPLWVEMRFRGVRVDIDKAVRVKTQLDERAALLHVELDKLAGFQVNINSGANLAKMFEALGVPYPHTATGKPSFKKDFLEHVEHPVGDLISNIRGLQKLSGTFIQSYILDANVGGYVHCQFHPLRGDQNGTRVGRLSSSDPNLQNIPTRTAEGKLVREIFVPQPGHRWRRYDFNQIQYRLLAHYAVGPGSDDMRARYNHDPRTDYHDATREMIHRIALMLLDRKPVKNINFGLTFAMGKKKLIRTLGVTKARGEELFKAYHASVPFVKATLEAFDDEAATTGVIASVLGRKSRFDLYEPADWRHKDEEERPVALPLELAVQRYGRIKRAGTHRALIRRMQGSEGDYMKASMWLCYKNGLYDYCGYPMVTVHDELGFSDSMDRADGWAEIMRLMVNAIPLRVPVHCGIEAGPNWGHVAELKE